MPKSLPQIQFHDDIAIADTAFTVRGKTSSRLFENASIALIQSMAEIRKIEPSRHKMVELKSESLDTLLFDYLNELLLLKDSENLIFSSFNIEITQKNSKWILKAKLSGEETDPEKHKVKIDIKAITMHMFKLERTKDGYKARVVVDI
ncbi:MAG: archease [Candidatus Dojkabacteria bacterium]|jgi:SHS2 domain-containing protein|nr:archease [Candidatus Dojkabacteria bacterium]